MLDLKYQTSLKWSLVKKLKSETKVKAWHINIEGKDYVVTQSFKPRLGETLSAFKADKRGKITEWRPLFEKPGQDYLIGIEYLLRFLEGQDIEKL